MAIATGTATITIINDDAASLSVQAHPGPVCAVPQDPNFRTSSTTNYVCQDASPPDAGDVMDSFAIDPYGNNLGDVTTSTSFSDFCSTANRFQSAVDVPYGTTSTQVQGTFGTATGQAPVTVGPESWSCQGQNYDVNQTDLDGCETPGSVASTDASNPTSLGDLSCNDTDTFTTDTLGAAYEVMASDNQVHEMPAVFGFDSATAARPCGSRSTRPVARSARTT